MVSDGDDSVFVLPFHSCSNMFIFEKQVISFSCDHFILSCLTYDIPHRHRYKIYTYACIFFLLKGKNLPFNSKGIVNVIIQFY